MSDNFLFNNPLLLNTRVYDSVELAKGDPVTFARKMNKKENKKNIAYEKRCQTAAEVFIDFDNIDEYFVLTKGQFSLLDTIGAVSSHMAYPIKMDISTWTASNDHVEIINQWKNAGRYSDVRWLLDLSHHRRDTAAAKRLRDIFGADFIRIGQNHAKFVLLSDNSGARCVIVTSANLNVNPRFETMSVRKDAEIFDFLNDFFDYVFQNQKCDLWETTIPGIMNHWRSL